MTELKKRLIFAVIGVVVGIALTLSLHRLISPKEPVQTRIDTVTVTHTVREYIRFEDPDPSTLVGCSTSTIRLPLPRHEETDSTAAPAADSADVEIPMETRIWEDRDSTYRIQTTGYNTNLDWVEIFPLHTYTENTITKTIKKKPRFAVGVQAGYGIGLSAGKPVGVPYIGIGGTYVIWSW